jgi:hypothetical protein
MGKALDGFFDVMQFVILLCYHCSMLDSKAEPDWLVGTIEVDGHTIPVVASGRTWEEAEGQARQMITTFQGGMLRLDARARLLSNLAPEISWRSEAEDEDTSS